MQVSDAQGSRNAAEELKLKLELEEQEIIKDIMSQTGTMKSRIQAWAENIEARINILALDFAIDQISSYISMKLREKQCLAASNIRHYLSDKYKDQNMMRVQKVNDNLEIALCGSPYRKPIEECSNTEIEFEHEYIDKTKNDTDKLLMLLNNRKETLEREALRRGMTTLGGEKLRDQISARDYRWEIEQDAELEELHQEVLTQIDRVIEEHYKFKANYDEYRVPLPLKDKVRQHGNSFRVFANIIGIVNEKKWSGEIDHWFDRNYWKKAQSSHKSGNSTFFPTTLCANCSSNIENDPKDFHVTKYDYTSSTGYRCDNCGSTEILTRENTREQVSDKSMEMDRIASEVVNHIPLYVQTFKDWRVWVLNPAIYARKKAISEEFVIASMGKEKKVVPRKKETGKEKVSRKPAIIQAAVEAWSNETSD